MILFLFASDTCAPTVEPTTPAATATVAPHLAPAADAAATITASDDAKSVSSSSSSSSDSDKEDTAALAAAATDTTTTTTTQASVDHKAAHAHARKVAEHSRATSTLVSRQAKLADTQEKLKALIGATTCDNTEAIAEIQTELSKAKVKLQKAEKASDKVAIAKWDAKVKTFEAQLLEAGELKAASLGAQQKRLEKSIEQQKELVTQAQKRLDDIVGKHAKAAAKATS